MNSKTLPCPQGTGLGNWRLRPYNTWSFQNVRQLIASANIKASIDPVPLSTDDPPKAPVVEGVDIEAQLTHTETDSLVVLKDGKKVWQWAAPYCDPSRPHIVFSISKSITAMMTGCLWGQGMIDLDKPVCFYLEGTRGSGYEDCTVQQLLDMTVALGFEEDYLNPDGDYFRYRNATCWNPVDQTADAPSMEQFLYSIGKADYPHGEKFAYKSPNSDLLGLLIERVAGLPYADLLSQLIWQPMGAETDGYVTVDRAMLARGAGGVCVTIDDLARFGQLVLNHGALGTRSIIPERWIVDTISAGDRHAWLKGDFTGLLPDGRYRNKWYQSGDPSQSYLALGIHGQWLLINPSTSVVIAKLSSQAEPLNDDVDAETLKLLLNISKSYGDS